MNKININYKPSQPIIIINNELDKTNNYQYGLKENNFDPTKNTPPNPNSWTRRLTSRFDIYYSELNKEQKRTNE
jgi:hypothetical protein